ncbi:MAG: PAS domain-containing protein [Actinomycetota bacterium]
MSDVSPGPAEQGDRSFDARYRALVEQIPAVTYVIPPGSPDLPCLHVSPQIERLSGYTPEEWMADPHLWERTIHPDDLDRVLAESRRVDDTDQPWHIEYRLVHRSGEVVWVHDRASILPDGAGARLWHGVLLDITAQKLAQEAQRESEERYRALVEQIPAGVYLVSVDGPPETIYVSPSIEDVTGFPVSAFQDDPTLWASRVVGEGADTALERWKAASATGERLEHEYQFLRADGTRIWIKDRSVGLRDGAGTTRYRQGLASDVSDRKIREQRLHESEAMYRALVENIPAVVYILAPDGDGSTLYVSPHVERLLGYTRQEWLDQPDIWMELLHHDDRERVLDAYDRANETGGRFAEEYRLIADDGRVVWFRDDATLVRDEEGRPQLWQGVRLDITDQKLAEQGLRTARDELDLRVRERTTSLEDANEMMMLEIAERKATETRLRRAEAKYRGLVEQIPGAVAYIWEVDPTSTFADAYTSPAIEQLLGYTVQEWHDGDFYLSRVHPDDYDLMLAATRRSERTGEPYDLEVRYLHKDGRVVWVRERAALLERSDDGRPKLFNAVMIDVTERKQAEDRVRAAEDRQRALLEQIPGAVAYVWEAGSDGAASPVGYISPQLASVLGYTVAEWTARAGFWRERVHPDDRDAVIRGTGRCEETGEPFAMEYRYLAKDGRVVWVMDQSLLVERGVDGGRGCSRACSSTSPNGSSTSGRSSKRRNATERWSSRSPRSCTSKRSTPRIRRSAAWCS